MQNIDWCEGGIQLADISTKDVGEPDLNPRMKYIMVRLDNWDITLVQEGWHNTGYLMEQELCINRLYWVEDYTQSVWNDCIRFDTWSENTLEDFARCKIKCDLKKINLNNY